MRIQVFFSLIPKDLAQDKKKKNSYHQGSVSAPPKSECLTMESVLEGMMRMEKGPETVLGADE